MAEGQDPSEVKKKRRFSGPYRGVLYSAVIFPGMGQLVEGTRARGAIIVCATLGFLGAGLGRFMYSALTAGDCPMLSGMKDVLPCVGWSMSTAWSRAGTFVLVCLAGLVVVYLIGIADAWLTARTRLAERASG